MEFAFEPNLKPLLYSLYSSPRPGRVLGRMLGRVPLNMAFLSHLNPIPSFPAHTGPYKVGTQDIEIPISELSSPAPSPEPTIPTVSFRIFYPCDTNSAHSQKSIHWLPNPQGGYFHGYAKFLGSSPRLASFLS